MAEPTIPGQNTGDEEEQDRLFDGNDPDEVKETVSAGLTSEEIGLNALSGAELSDPTRVENHAGGEKSAQDVTNELDESAQGYASGHDSGVSQKEQYDVALSGAAEGRHEGTYFDSVQQDKEFREREERKNIAVRALTTYADLLNFAIELGKDIKKLNDDFNITNEYILEIEEAMDEQVNMLDQEIAEQQRIIDEFNARVENGEPITAIEQVTHDTAELRLKALEKVRDAVVFEKETLINNLNDTKQEIDQLTLAYNDKLREIEAAGGANDSERAALEQELKDIESQMLASRSELTRLTQHAEFAKGGLEQYTQFAAYITSSEHDLSPDSIEALSSFASEYINARADGQISQSDMDDMRVWLQAPNLPAEAKAGIEQILATSMSGSGIGVSTGQYDDQGNEIFAYGEDASALLLQGLRGEITAADTDYEDVSVQANTAISQLESQRNTLEDELQAHIDDLDAIRAGTSVLIPIGAEQDMIDAQETLKLAEIENARARLSLLNQTIDGTQEQLEDTRASYIAAHQTLQDLEDQKARGTADTDIDQKIEDARNKIDFYKGQIEDLGTRTDLAASISELTIRIEGKSQSCGLSAADELAKAEVIQERTALTRYIEEATEDGKIDQAEMDIINQRFDNAQISQESRHNFINAFALSGGGVASGQVDENGEAVYVYGEDATSILLAELAQVEAQKAAAETQLSQTSADQAELQQRLADLQAQRAQQQETLDNAQAALDAESAETVEVVADAEGAHSGMLAYESVFDYMSNNYTYKGFGLGSENVSDIAQQADRILKDESGNLVYVDPNTQEMYTLAKNDDGSIARDAEGNQIQVPVSAEDTVDLYNQMFENKLLPRNFVPDGDGFTVGAFGVEMQVGEQEVAYAEHSEHDSFTESITKSMAGMMGKDQFSQVIDTSVAAQRAQEDAARLAQVEAQSDIDEARLALENASNDLNATDEEIQRLTRELASLQEKQQQLQQEVAQRADRDAAAAAAIASSGENGGQGTEGWDGTESMKLETSEQYQNAIIDVYRKVESGAITKEDLDQALSQTESPELRQQIEAALERDGIDITEPENNIAGAELEPELDNTNNDMQMAGYTQIMAAFPFLGIGPFQVSPIPTPQNQADPNGIYPSMTGYQSFADSMEFASTNPTNGPDPTYMDPVNNGTKDTPSAGDGFAVALTNTGAPGSDTTIKAPQLSAEEALRLQREEELRLAETQAGLNNTGGAPMG